MLCRVEFLAPTGGRTAGGAADDGKQSPGGAVAVDVYVPEDALLMVAGEPATAWVVEPESRRATRRAVTPGTGSRDAHRQVMEGLLPGEWVVLRPTATLKDGTRVRVGNMKGNTPP
jgi:multidrug efflux pump subunit AcrA (membrane-fusion protein)